MGFNFRKSAGKILPIAGAIVGGIFGGPAGAVAGASVGRIGGKAIEGKSNQRGTFTPSSSGSIDQARSQDKTRMKGQYGIGPDTSGSGPLEY